VDRRVSGTVFLAFSGLLLTVALVAPRGALADGTTAPPASFVYYPANGTNPAELLDTRSGAIFRRNDSDNRWDPVIKPVKEE